MYGILGAFADSQARAAHLDDCVEIGELRHVIILDGAGLRIGRGGQKPCRIQLCRDLCLDIWVL